MKNHRENWVKYVVGIGICLGVRLLPFRPPNVEPVMATLMPFAKQGGAAVGLLFGVLSIVFYDAVTGTMGAWTVFTAGAYGMVGIGASWFLRGAKNSPLSYAGYAVIGTIFFDAATGLTTGPLLFHQPFIAALMGQIPFTLLHLAGNVTLALTVSPFLYRWVVMNKNLSSSGFFAVGKVGNANIS